METFQNLKILIPENFIATFYNELVNEIENSSWKIQYDIMNNFKRNSISETKYVLCILSDSYLFNNKTIEGLVWLRENRGYFELFNVMPTKYSSFTRSEYNFLLNKFTEIFVNPLVAKHNNIEVNISSAEKQIIETIGDKGLKLLEFFSDTANKSTGNTNYYDFRRWCDFVFYIFRSNIELSSDELEKWFLNHGWDDKLALKLSLDYEYSIDLLKNYEQY